MNKRIIAFVIVLLSLPAIAQIEVPNPIPNDTVTGTTQNKLVKYNTTSSATSVILAATTDTTGIVGICADGCGTSGKASIITLGQASCIFDNTTVANDYVQIAAGVAGDCHDVGATKPISGQIIGRVFGAGGSAGTYAVHLILQDPAASTTVPPCVVLGSSDTISAAGTFATTCSMPAPAGIGSIIEIDVQGVYTTTATASPTFQMQINVGGATGTCAMPGKITIVTGQTAGPWNLRCYVQIATTGAPGTAYVWGMANESGALGGSANVMPMYNGGAGTSSFTTTSAQTISVQETATLVSGQTFTLQSFFARNY